MEVTDKASGGTAVLVADVTAPTSVYSFNNLNPSSNYTFRVRLVDSSSRTDTNKNDLSSTTLAHTVTHNGWTHIKAVGAKTPAAQGTGISADVASVTLTWPAVTPSSGSITSYNIYRATTSGGQDYNSPLATGITTAALSYTDLSITAGSTYYYTIAPVINGSTIVPTVVADSEVKVIVPLDNLVLLHRWAANKEMCEQMGLTADRTNNYRCASTAPGNTSGYIDLTTSRFIDMFEQGCNYTATNTCTDATVSGGAASPCIGIRSTPDTFVTAPINTIYYSRYSGTCFINNNGTTGWTSAAIYLPNQVSMASGAPGLPPLVRVNQPQSQSACRSQLVTGFGYKRLISRIEQVMVSAWDASMDDTSINNMEIGANLRTSPQCNASSASPQGSAPATDISVGANSAYAFDNLTIPTNKDTLPGCWKEDCSAAATSTALIRSLRTGSNSTNTCVSRYGAQDLVGNVWEWTTDQIYYNGSTYNGVSDGFNTDFIGVIFDGVFGPITTGTFTSFGKIQLPIGIPIVSANPAGTVTQTAAQFHGDNFTISGSGIRTPMTGGTWNGGANAGRFALLWGQQTDTSNRTVGFRCSIPAE